MPSTPIVTASGPLVQELAFSVAEYQERLARLRCRIEDLELDALLSWTPENILYMTGHDTPGYYYYQCCVITLDADPVNVLRYSEASNTWGRSAYRHVAAYRDHEDPVARTFEVLQELGVARGRIGVEANAWFISPARYAQLERLVTGAGGQPFADASMSIESLRTVKSDAEIGYIRAGCRAADAAAGAAIDAMAPGATEDDLAAAVWTSLIGAGSQAAGLPPFIVSGPRTTLCHATWSGRVLEPGDVVLLELPGVFERYVGAIARTAFIGQPDAEFRRRAEAVAQTTDVMIDAMRPGVTGAEVQDACRRSLDKAGYGQFHTHRSGYSIGLNYAPDWGEGHIFSLIDTEHRPLQQNMTFHLIPDIRTDQYTLMISESVIVTETGCERLTAYPRSLSVR